MNPDAPRTATQKIRVVLAVVREVRGFLARIEHILSGDASEVPPSAPDPRPEDRDG